jgi:hypothetical protein
LKITGEALPVLPDVTVVRNRGLSAIATVSATGTLVYASAKSAIQGDVVSVSRSGDERTILTTELAASNPRLQRFGFFERRARSGDVAESVIIMTAPASVRRYSCRARRT